MRDIKKSLKALGFDDKIWSKKNHKLSFQDKTMKKFIRETLLDEQ